MLIICDVHAVPGNVTATVSVWHDPSVLPAEIQPKATASLLLDSVKAADRFIAVGERGHVLISLDGVSWRQVEAVPTRATFTAVTAIGKDLWAVGHDGIIIHSADAGEHWQLQRNDAHRLNVAGNADPRQGAPLLDVLFLDAKRGFAVGAYSQLLVTQDGGKIWSQQDIFAAEKIEKKQESNKDTWVFDKEELKLSQETDPHLNAIARTGNGSLMIAAERGTAFRSRDNGNHWERIQLPYDGSMFGVIGFEEEHVLVFGLRGHVYESTDLGDHWQSIATGAELSIMGGHKWNDDGVILVGANGWILVRPHSDQPFQSYLNQSAGMLANGLPIDAGSALILVGENGVSRYVLQAIPASNTPH